MMSSTPAASTPTHPLPFPSSYHLRYGNSPISIGECHQPWQKLPSGSGVASTQDAMGATTMLVLSAMLLLLAEQRARAASDAGFSVEFIHRDSPRSPFHDPALSPHGR